jgi:SOS-response transcriptional repressor LexA
MLIATQSAEYLLVEVCLPGRRPETAGVLLYHPAENRLEGKFRRDWARIADEDEEEVLAGMPEHLETLTQELGAEEALRLWEETWSNTVRISERRSVLSAGFQSTLRRLYNEHVQSTVIRFQTHLPVYSLRAAAGKWGDQMPVEEEPEGDEGWMEVPEDLRLTKDMFIARVVGRSMEPVIPDGSLCVFRRNVVGSRQRKLLLVENFEQSEAGGQRYTVKRYFSKKDSSKDSDWTHTVVRFEPLNPEFDAWEITEGHQCRVLAEFIRVLE